MILVVNNGHNLMGDNVNDDTLSRLMRQRTWPVADFYDSIALPWKTRLSYCSSINAINRHCPSNNIMFIVPQSFESSRQSPPTFTIENYHVPILSPIKASKYFKNDEVDP